MENMEERFKRIDRRMNKGVYLYGAGANGEWVLDYCRRGGICVLGFIDSDTTKQGKNIAGIPCLSYNEYKNSKHSDCNVLITAKHDVECIFAQFMDNSNIISFDTWFVMKHEEEYHSLHFEDDLSYQTLTAVKKAMKTGEIKYLWEIANRNQYISFPPFWGGRNEILVELGACTGETIERILLMGYGYVKKVYAFEPGEKQFAALQRRVERIAKEWAFDSQRIVVENCAVGSQSGLVGFDDSSAPIMNHCSPFSSKQVRMIMLDKYFADCDVTFIIADIEGSEMDALRGSVSLIQRCRPKMAISVYHKPDDLFQIYSFINSLQLGYKFKLRHHESTLGDTILYCYT